MKVRVVYKEDKSVAILYPAPKSKFSTEEALERMMEKNGFKGLPYEDMDSSQLPKDRENRNAWEGEKGKGVIINTQKAKKIKEAKQGKETAKIDAKKNLKKAGLNNKTIDLILSK